MPAPILIAYATRAGSTGEVAVALAKELRDAGLTLDVMPVSEVDSLDGRTALILGAPLYIGRFPDEFHRFLARHRAALTSLLPWCFVLGPTRVESADFEAAQSQALKQFEKYRWVHPAEIRIFGGRWDINHLPFPFSLIRRIPFLPTNKIPAADIRDWSAIRQWAHLIAQKIEPAA